MKDNTIVYVKEIYRDEEDTLTQGIIYKYGDNRDREYQRSRLVPYMTRLIRTDYLNCDWDVVKEESNNEKK